MSDVMLHGVLRMPPEMWSDTALDKAQRYSRYVQASDRIMEDEEKIDKLLAAIDKVMKAKGRYHTELAYRELMVLRATL